MEAIGKEIGYNLCVRNWASTANCVETMRGRMGRKNWKKLHKRWEGDRIGTWKEPRKENMEGTE